MRYFLVLIVAMLSAGCSRSYLSHSSENVILLDDSGLKECKVVSILTARGFLSPEYTMGAVEYDDPYLNKKYNPSPPRFTLGRSTHGSSSGPYKLKGAGCSAVLSESSRYLILHLEPLILGEVVDISDDQPGVWEATHEYRKKLYRTLWFATADDLGRQLTGVYEVHRGNLVPINKSNTVLVDIERVARNNFVIAEEPHDPE